MARTLVQHLEHTLADSPPAPLCVAFSGGPDSSALLHALAALDTARTRGLRAVHVDHGLQPPSRAWARHCQQQCQALGVPMQSVRVQVAGTGEGLESAARSARYAALGKQLRSGEWLVTAHHADDQAETVLLKLLRGAGPRGMGGMRPLRPLAAGALWRPLLELPRATLQAYLHEHDVACIEDPSNTRDEHARSFLRAQILPRLRRHWPEAPRILGLGARLSADAADFIEAHAASALERLYREHDASLEADAWLQLHPALRGLVLERWLYGRRLTAPTRLQRQELEHQVHDAASDRVPEVTWPGTRVRCWRGRLYAHAATRQPPGTWRSAWDGSPLDLPGGGCLRLDGDREPAALPALEVRLGQIGVHLKPEGDAHTRSLRDLFQRAGIPPWQRRACPLIHAADGDLLAVADLWLTPSGAELFRRHHVHPHWQSDI